MSEPGNGSAWYAVAWTLALAQFFGALLSAVVWSLWSRNRGVNVFNEDAAAPEVDVNCSPYDGDRAYDDDSSEFDESVLQLVANAAAAPSARLRLTVGLAYLFLHCLTCTALLTAGVERGFDKLGMLNLYAVVTSTIYLILVWIFDIPYLSCHGRIALRARLPVPYGMLSCCVRAAVVSAPLILAAASLLTRSVFGIILYFGIVSYHMAVQLQFWWAPYFLGSAPQVTVAMYLQLARQHVWQLPRTSRSSIQPDLQHLILLPLSAFMALVCWIFFLRMIFTGTTGSPLPHPLPGSSPAWI